LLAHTPPPPDGTPPDGIPEDGIPPDGISPDGIPVGTPPDVIPPDGTPVDGTPTRGPRLAPQLTTLLACVAVLAYVIALYLTDFRITVSPSYQTATPDLSAFIKEGATGKPSVAAAKPVPYRPAQKPQAGPTMLRHDSLYPALTQEREVDTTRHRILLMGDSMGDALFFGLKDLCAWSGYRLKVVAIKSTTSLFWADTDTLAYAIQQFKPTLVLFTCGANEITIPRLRVRKKMYAQLLQRFSSLPYIWVGTPVWTGDTVYNAMMGELVPQDQFFNSTGLGLRLQPDGAHPNLAGSRTWADTLAKWMVYHSRYPLYWQLKKPAGHARPKRQKPPVSYKQLAKPAGYARPNEENIPFISKQEAISAPFNDTKKQVAAHPMPASTQGVVPLKKKILKPLARHINKAAHRPTLDSLDARYNR